MIVNCIIIIIITYNNSAPSPRAVSLFGDGYFFITIGIINDISAHETTLFLINILKTRRPMTLKYYMYVHWYLAYMVPIDRGGAGSRSE